MSMNNYVKTRPEHEIRAAINSWKARPKRKQVRFCGLYKIKDGKWMRMQEIAKKQHQVRKLTGNSELDKANEQQLLALERWEEELPNILTYQQDLAYTDEYSKIKRSTNHFRSERGTPELAAAPHDQDIIEIWEFLLKKPYKLVTKRGQTKASYKLPNLPYGLICKAVRLRLGGLSGINAHKELLKTNHWLRQDIEDTHPMLQQRLAPIVNEMYYRYKQ